MDELYVQKEKMFELMMNMGYGSDVIKKQTLIIDRFIKYLNDNSLELTFESANLFSESYYEIFPSSRVKEYCTTKSKAAVLKFLRFVEDGEINSRWIPRTKKLVGVHATNFDLFIEDERRKLKLSTLREYSLVVREFNTYLNSNNILTITSKDITDYFLELSKVNAHPHAFYHRTTIIKKLMSFLYTNRLISEDLSKCVPKAKYQRTKDLPSAYSNEEVSRLLNSIDRNSDVGKRDYAMISLALYLGLRAGDIVNLKFENINWESNKIELTMGKTDKQITLPLLPEVGNAIFDYVKNSRRKSDSKYVFLSCKGKITNVGSGALYSCIKHYFTKVNINTNGRKKGPHSLRHSLASRMLKEGQPLEIISEALGHSDTQVTTIYTSIDFNSLKDCALEVLPIKSSAYQGGNSDAS